MLCNSSQRSCEPKTTNKFCLKLGRAWRHVDILVIGRSNLTLTVSTGAAPFRCLTATPSDLLSAAKIPRSSKEIFVSNSDYLPNAPRDGAFHGQSAARWN